MTVGRLVPPPSLPTEIARMTLAHLPATTSLDSIYPFACTLAAAALKVERVGIWFLDDNGTCLRCANVYQMSKGTHSSGMVLEVGKISCYIESLQRRRSLPVEIVEALPWTAELFTSYCEPLGITSILDAGIFHNGHLAGVVCHEHIGPVRDWSTEERHFAESLADFIASRLRSVGDGVPLTTHSSEVSPKSRQEQFVSAKDAFREISNASLRVKSLMNGEVSESVIQQRLAVLNREIAVASSEALKLLADL